MLMDGIPQVSCSVSAVGELCYGYAFVYSPCDKYQRVSAFTFRVCPGRHFAESTLFIFCASVLSTFEIGPPVGGDGAPVEVKWEATDHLVIS